MTIHLHRDLDLLRRELLAMGALVEEATNKAINALIRRDRDMAREVLESDATIDLKEIEVEEDCLKLLALHQPVAVDLRYIITCLKVNNDLERMGDLAVNIAERADYLARHPPLTLPADLREMADGTRAMVRDSLDALVRQDPALARDILERDDAIDEHNRLMFDQMVSTMMNDPDMVKRAIAFLSSSRALERIADHATNVAEEVIFMCEGEIIRHRAERLNE
ncbi:MAG: phosphate signaling complex protein PhoU [Acidobacteriota bacterium]